MAGGACRLSAPSGIVSSLGGLNGEFARVVAMHDARATELFSPKADRVRDMFQRGLTNLTGHASTKESWLSLVSTQEIVGLKVYTAPGPVIGTRLPVVAAIIEGMLEAGFDPSHIIVWDRDLASLRGAGYDVLARRYKIRLAGALQEGFDEDVFYEDPLLGHLIFGDHEFEKTGKEVGRKSFVSTLVTTQMTRILMVSPLLNHNGAGVCGHLYSLAMGSTDNNIRFDQTPARLAKAVPEICALPELGDRVVLNITDGLVCQYQGQDQGLLHYSTMLGEVWFSKDPVALDVLSIQELKRQRDAAGIQTGVLNEDLYKNASLLQIGISQPNRIQLERISIATP